MPNERWPYGDILKADKTSMILSLKVCVLFLDQNFFAVVRYLPTKYLVTRKQTKYAPRQAARKHLPKSVISFGAKDINYDC